MVGSVVTTGSKGISKTALRGRLNIGKLESRMICKVLERNKMIKVIHTYTDTQCYVVDVLHVTMLGVCVCQGFMEDVGRQRTTKYISKLFVEKSKLNLEFTKEKERSEKLRAPQEDTPTPVPEDTPTPRLGTDVELQKEAQSPAKGKKSKVKGSKSNSAQKKQQKEVTTSPLRHSTPLRSE